MLWPVVRPTRTHRDGTVDYERKFGALRVYEAPRKGAAYILAGDPSGGVGMDEAAACVLEYRSGQVVAAWDDDRVKPGDFGNVLAAIGRYYNNALIAPEIQLDGRGGRETIAVLEREERYPAIFEYKPGATGWSTDELTRPVLFGDMGKLIESGRIWTPDAKTAGEVRTLVHDEKTGRIVARGKGTKSGADDGLFIAWAIAHQVRQRMPSRGHVPPQVGGALSSPSFRT
jgi:hypothetical protein